MLTGDRQYIDYDMFYRNYSFMNDTQDLWDLFSNDNVEENLSNFNLNIRYKELIDSVEYGLKSGVNYVYQESNEPLIESYDDGSVTVCISGGKDSVAVAVLLKETGHKVNLFYVDGINKGYPDEKESVINIAEKLGLDLHIEKVKLKGKKFFVEHPLKNQMIASLAIAYCLGKNIAPHIYFGDVITDDYNECNFGVNWCDCYNVWEGYNKFISRAVSGAYVKMILNEPDDSLKVFLNHPDLIEHYKSCMITLKYRNGLKRTNEQKYNISLLNNRCGSCRKCCMEYIYYTDNGIFEYNESFYLHCMDVLRKKHAEYFGPTKKKPETMRDVYEDFFHSYKFEDSMLFKSNRDFADVKV